MQRVNVIGPSCSGKSTTAREVSDRLGVPYVELDALHHQPGWTEATAEELQASVGDALDAAPEGWVVDGNYFGKLGDFVLTRADTVVWLDVPYRTAIRRVLRRTASRLVTRAELWNGNRESLSLTFGRNSIVLWVLCYHRGFAEKWEPRLAANRHLDVVRLRSEREVNDWLQSIQATPEMSGSSSASARQKTPPFVET